jgi:hypothetical protein
MTTMQSAQLAYDNRSPDESPEPLEMVEVANWIESEAERLLSGHDVKIGNRVIVNAYQLSDMVADEVVKRFQAGDDQDGNLGQLILAALDHEPAKAAGTALGLFGSEVDWCRDAAIELLEPFAKEILDQLIEDARDDY